MSFGESESTPTSRGNSDVCPQPCRAWTLEPSKSLLDAGIESPQNCWARAAPHELQGACLYHHAKVARAAEPDAFNPTAFPATLSRPFLVTLPVVHFPVNHSYPYPCLTSALGEPHLRRGPWPRAVPQRPYLCRNHGPRLPAHLACHSPTHLACHSPTASVGWNREAKRQGSLWGSTK